jgi:putative ABC transport system substrate-binding protein
MKRRDFITLLGGAATAWPLATRAQQPAMPVIGILSTGARESDDIRLGPLRQGLLETGYVENRNVSIEFRWAEERPDRLPSLAADLVRRRVDVIAAIGAPTAALAAKASTATIPIVFGTGVDPVEVGLVASLNRPGGNLTGVTNLSVELAAKRLELLHKCVPWVTIVALLVNPDNPNTEPQSRDSQLAARALGLELVVLHARSEHDLDVVFERLAELHVGALAIAGDGFFNSHAAQLAARALAHTMPVIYQFREFAAGGGLMSYGSSLADQYHLVGLYTGRILKGEKPGNLPVVQPTTFEFAINLKTAKALNIDVPPTLLAIADEVIE